ncbi:hypothetical protein CJ030_MR0G020162 [Morella rubra]|uniref:Uncharacterized protein n=1 Tax=Morella rubra TaxID=262757 RepID=A0A6A1UG98_9ROSI|nr:hypothetical protein CJ030_MR0G020162 [Morella rubra]
MMLRQWISDPAYEVKRHLSALVQQHLEYGTDHSRKQFFFFEPISDEWLHEILYSRSSRTGMTSGARDLHVQSKFALQKQIALTSVQRCQRYLCLQPHCESRISFFEFSHRI